MHRVLLLLHAGRRRPLHGRGAALHLRPVLLRGHAEQRAQQERAAAAAGGGGLLSRFVQYVTGDAVVRTEPALRAACAAGDREVVLDGEITLSGDRQTDYGEDAGTWALGTGTLQLADGTTLRGATLRGCGAGGGGRRCLTRRGRHNPRQPGLRDPCGGRRRGCGAGRPDRGQPGLRRRRVRCGLEGQPDGRGRGEQRGLRHLGGGRRRGQNESPVSDSAEHDYCEGGGGRMEGVARELIQVE